MFSNAKATININIGLSLLNPMNINLWSILFQIVRFGENQHKTFHFFQKKYYFKNLFSSTTCSMKLTYICPTSIQLTLTQKFQNSTIIYYYFFSVCSYFFTVFSLPFQDFVIYLNKFQKISKFIDQREKLTSLYKCFACELFFKLVYTTVRSKILFRLPKFGNFWRYSE